MTVQVRITKPVDLAGLGDEFAAAGLVPAYLGADDDPTAIRADFDTSDPTPDGVAAERAAILSKVGVVVAAHDLVAILAARQQAVLAAQTATTETTAAKSDLATNYAAAQTALDQILAATSMTNTQLFNAVQAEARILKRTLRLLKAALT